MSNTAKARWGGEEDALLVKRMEECRTGSGSVEWTNVATSFPGRTAKQCRERWIGTLNPGLNRAPWSDDEVAKMFQLVTKYGTSWKQISIKLGTGRSELMVRNLWYARQRQHAKQNARQDRGLKERRGRPTGASSSALAADDSDDAQPMGSNRVSGVSADAPAAAGWDDIDDDAGQEDGVDESLVPAAVGGDSAGAAKRLADGATPRGSPKASQSPRGCEGGGEGLHEGAGSGSGSARFARRPRNSTGSATSDAVVSVSGPDYSPLSTCGGLDEPGAAGATGEHQARAGKRATKRPHRFEDASDSNDFPTHSGDTSSTGGVLTGTGGGGVVGVGVGGEAVAEQPPSQRRKRTHSMIGYGDVEYATHLALRGSHGGHGPYGALHTSIPQLPPLPIFPSHSPSSSPLSFTGNGGGGVGGTSRSQSGSGGGGGSKGKRGRPSKTKTPPSSGGGVGGSGSAGKAAMYGGYGGYTGMAGMVGGMGALPGMGHDSDTSVGEGGGGGTDPHVCPLCLEHYTATGHYPPPGSHAHLPAGSPPSLGHLPLPMPGYPYPLPQPSAQTPWATAAAAVTASHHGRPKRSAAAAASDSESSNGSGDGMVPGSRGGGVGVGRARARSNSSAGNGGGQGLGIGAVRGSQGQAGPASVGLGGVGGSNGTSAGTGKGSGGRARAGSGRGERGSNGGSAAGGFDLADLEAIGPLTALSMGQGVRRTLPAAPGEEVAQKAPTSVSITGHLSFAVPNGLHFDGLHSLSPSEGSTQGTVPGATAGVSTMSRTAEAGVLAQVAHALV